LTSSDCRSHSSVSILCLFNSFSSVIHLIIHFFHLSKYQFPFVLLPGGIHPNIYLAHRLPVILSMCPYSFVSILPKYSSINPHFPYLSDLEFRFCLTFLPMVS
jgi:hypothetical protein